MPLAKAEKLGFMSQDARMEMRDRIFATGVPAVIFQPVTFIENLLNPWIYPLIVNEGRILHPHPAALEMTFLSHEDLAALMVAALDRVHRVAGRAIPIGGREVIRGTDLARRLSAAWNTSLRYEEEDLKSYARRLADHFEGKTALPRDRLMVEIEKIIRGSTRSRRSR